MLFSRVQRKTTAVCLSPENKTRQNSIEIERCTTAAGNEVEPNSTEFSLCEQTFQQKFSHDRYRRNSVILLMSRRRFGSIDIVESTEERCGWIARVFRQDVF